jgi:hypothetical protein
MYSSNKKILTEGWHIGSQTPVDDRLVFSNIADLQDLGVGNQNVFRYYEGMVAWVISEQKIFVWIESTTGFLTSSYTYPSDTVANGINYGGRSFNFIDVNAATTVDKLLSWVGGVPYLENQEVYATSLTSGHVTLYKRNNDGNSGLSFDATEELEWTPISSFGSERRFIADSSLAPTVPGEPSLLEIETYCFLINVKDCLAHYTGNDIEDDPPKYVYWVDVVGKVTLVKENSGSVGALKFVSTESFVANTPLTVTHNLGTTDYIVQIYDEFGAGLFLPEQINNTAANTVSITCSEAGDYKVIIVG